MHQGDLPIPQTVSAAFLGSLCGITSSYLLGRTAGHYIILRYGKWVGIGQEQLDKAHAWFERFGKWGYSLGISSPAFGILPAYLPGWPPFVIRILPFLPIAGGLSGFPLFYRSVISLETIGSLSLKTLKSAIIS